VTWFTLLSKANTANSELINPQNVSEVLLSKRICHMPFRWVIVSFLSGLGLMAQAALAEPQMSDRQAMQAARAGSEALTRALTRQLRDYMASYGAAGALSACKVDAQLITRTIGAERNLTIKRTALRVRNPANTATELEQQILNDFQSAIELGADPLVLERVVRLKDGRWQYARPIMMGPLCTGCHGQSIDETVQRAIDSIYPEDEATGFSPGMLRGAFVVTLGEETSVVTASN
jgi:hypothetical protein